MIGYVEMSTINGKIIYVYKTRKLYEDEYKERNDFCIVPAVRLCNFVVHKKDLYLVSFSAF